MKETYMLIIVACILLFSGCVSEENKATIKEITPERTEKMASTTTGENFFSGTTLEHEHNPEKICSYPADAFSACAEKKDNESCEYSANGTILSGKCATEPCGKVVCKSA